ncbi:MAG TPA: hypothetical protein DEF47_13040 [Herpetosiphon sp.]|uniref:Uncharacterized protein n=1 Tax=Herpetosiphon aurantiacus (strain ATCC 23779 / DSM 785 / 114-95) TaxID=316274 RepID=A9AUG2_HERA2|nr:hypothetical protein [Herpetosiphon sp.]ABX03081.1 hypothetical protein Haur_0430 [Herpetosiphon aurantiacus DSM 785]HBW50816.1 hypothetical protein [Herpetosiphon sp.]
MEERSQRAKIGGSGRRWQVFPVLGGVGLLVTMLLVTQTPEPPAPLPTATVVAEAVVTPSISTQPTPQNPISSLPAVDLAGQQLLFIDPNNQIKLWDGVGLVQSRGTVERLYGSSGWGLTVDQHRDVLFIRGFDWLEARSLRDNRRLWQLPITAYANNTETTILDVVSDPFNQLVWLVEKQRTTDAFQPATVRVRGLDSRSGLELRRYQTPLVNDPPHVLPIVNGPWLLADGQLLPFDPASEAFGKPLMSRLEFVQVAPDGKQALVFGANSLIEIDLLTQQTLKQTELATAPKINSIEHIIASPNFNYVLIIGTVFEETDFSQHIFVYDRDGIQVGSWQRKLLAERTHIVDTDVSNHIRFLDDQRLVLLHRTGMLEIINLATDSMQLISLREKPDLFERLEHLAGFELMPKLELLPLVENPELEYLEAPGFASAPLTPTTAPKPFGLTSIDGQITQLWDDGSSKTINQLVRTLIPYLIRRNNAPPLFIDLIDTDLVLIDPVNQTTHSIALEPIEAKSLDDLEGISASNSASIVICYSYHLDSSADSRVNRCRELNLQTGQTSLFAELPAATDLIPIYWDGRQLTIVGKTYREAKRSFDYLVWQTLADDRSQGQMLLQPLDVQQLWYMVGSPTVIYQNMLGNIVSYQLLDQNPALLIQRSADHDIDVDLAPNGQRVVLIEREYPLNHGTLTMFDTATGAELWRDDTTRDHVGLWSGDSQFYLTRTYQAVNSSLNTYTHQGKQGHSLLVAQGIGEFVPDWLGQQVVLRIYDELFLLERVNEHWLPLSKFPNFQTVFSSRSWPKIVYVYPQP